MTDATVLAEMSKPHRADLFWSRLAPDGDCLTWTMAKNPNGYGVFRIGFDGRRFTCSAHRIAWMLANGQVVPAGYEVDHLCRQPSCCRPDHLEAVPKRENTARAHGRSLVTLPAPVRSGRASIHVRRRASGEKYLVTWRDYMPDGSVIQRGELYDTREEAQAAVDMSTG